MSFVKGIKNKRQETDRVSGISFKQMPKIKDVAFIKDEIAFVLNDERIIYIPLSWSKKLQRAKPRQRQFINSYFNIYLLSILPIFSGNCFNILNIADKKPAPFLKRQALYF